MFKKFLGFCIVTVLCVAASVLGLLGGMALWVLFENIFAIAVGATVAAIGLIIWHQRHITLKRAQE